jgi:LysM repeat protein
MPSKPGMPEPAPVCNGTMHTVRAGDTFYMLAKRHNISLEDLLAANPGVNPYNLRIGQQICIPAYMKMPEEHGPGSRGIIHTVKSETHCICWQNNIN